MQPTDYFKCIIVAEAGVNHNGSLDLAEKLVEAAATAGADYVKFQTFKAQNLVTHNAPKAGYQAKNTGKDDGQFNMLKQLELTPQMHIDLIKICKKNNIKFLSTPFGQEEADYLVDKVDFFKVPSGELTNHPFLIHLCKKKKPLVLSTGMANLDEVKTAILVIEKSFKEVGINYKSNIKTSLGSMPALTVLQCTTSYPTPYTDVNLRAMNSMRNELNIPVGYSDHTLGIEIPVAARALGAVFIEKHFTLDRNMEGPDHLASLEPTELKQMVQSIRNVELALGDGVKKPQSAEEANIKIARKSLYYRKKLKAGCKITEDDLQAKRPAVGLSPDLLDKIISKTLSKDVDIDQLVSNEDFQ